MENIDSIIMISELIARERSGQLSQQDQETLEKWVSSSEQNRQLYLKIKDGKNFASRNFVYDGVDVRRAWSKFSKTVLIEPKRRIMPMLLLYAAAIFIPVLMGITTYWYLMERPQKTAPVIAKITPGNQHAVLVMANGKNITLSNDSIKDLIENDGTVIKNSRKELSYAEQNSNNSQKSILNTLIVPQGGEYTLVLSDGTRVFVNSMSKLIFPVNFTGDKREVTLEGEACFEVTKDNSRPFIVTIKGMQVEVMGTTFNIKAYANDDQSYTTLVEGKVRISPGAQASNSSIIEPDQQAVYNHATSDIVVQKVDAKQFTQWTTGKYIFSNQPLDEIMKSLSRWYDFNYQFEDASLKMIRFEGGLNKYESIDPILEIIRKTGKVRIAVNGKDILFSKI